MWEKQPAWALCVLAAPEPLLALIPGTSGCGAAAPGSGGCDGAGSVPAALLPPPAWPGPFLRGRAHPIPGGDLRCRIGFLGPGITLRPSREPSSIDNSAAAAAGCGGRAGAASRPRRAAPWRTAWGRSRGPPSCPPARGPWLPGPPEPALGWCFTRSWPTAAPRGASRASPTSRSSTPKLLRSSASRPLR